MTSILFTKTMIDSYKKTKSIHRSLEKGIHLFPCIILTVVSSPLLLWCYSIIYSCDSITSFMKEKRKKEKEKEKEKEIKEITKY